MSVSTAQGGGVNDTLLGVNYQNKIFMYTALKVKKEGVTFKLGTEIKEAGKFDDCVLLCENPTKNYFLQAKHKRTRVDLTIDSFFTDEKYMLPKYFLSFKGIKSHYGQIEKLMIVTNNGLVDELKSKSSDIYLEKVSDKDIIYGEFKSRYKFKSNESIVEMLRENVEEYILIAKDLAQSNFSKLGKYKKVLKKYVLDKDNRQFKTSFIESSEYTEFKKVFENVYLDKCPKKGQNLTSNFWGNINKQVKFTSNVEFWKADVDLSTSDYILKPKHKNNDFKEFLAKLEIVVETTIDDINEKIEKISGVKMASSNETEDLKNEFDKWIQNNSGLFTDGDLEKLRQTVELKSNLVYLNLLKNDFYESKVENSGIYFEMEDQELKDFLTRSDIDDNIACLHTSKEQTLINTIRVFRALESFDLENFVFLRSEMSKSKIESSLKMIENLSSAEICVLECNDSSADFFSTNFKEFLDIFNNNSQKRLIIITDVSKIFSSPDNSNAKLRILNRKNMISDLSAESIDQLLHKEVDFQGQFVSINKLLSNIEDIKSLSIVNLLDEAFKIGKNIPRHNSYDPNFYIKRTLVRNSQKFSEVEFLDHNSDKVVLISDKAGMGKSCLLTSLSLILKKKNPNLFVFRIDLNDLTKRFQIFQEENYSQENLNNFIINDLLLISSSFETVLFKEYQESGQGLVIFLDGFDEVSPYYDKVAIDFVRTFKDLGFEKILLSTRPEKQEDLEKEFQCSSFSILPFPEEDQIEFLMKYWEKNARGEILKSFANEILKTLNDKINDKDFISIPLATKIIGELFKQHLTKNRNTEDVLNFASKLTLNDLYEYYINSKYKIYFDEKKEIDGSKNKHFIKIYREKLDKYFLSIAIKEVFPEETIKQLPNYDKFLKETKIKIDMIKCGLVYLKDGMLPKFYHKTFAEYFVAKYLLNNILNCDDIVYPDLTNLNLNSKISHILIDVVLTQPRYHVLRSFIDGCISKHLNLFKFAIGKEIIIKVKLYSIFERALMENNMNSFKFFSDCIVSYENLVASQAIHLNEIMTLYIIGFNDDLNFLLSLQSSISLEMLEIFKDSKEKIEILLELILMNRNPKSIRVFIEWLQNYLQFDNEILREFLLNDQLKVFNKVITSYSDLSEMRIKVTGILEWVQEMFTLSTEELKKIIIKICCNFHENFKFHLEILNQVQFDPTFYVQILSSNGLIKNVEVISKDSDRYANLENSSDDCPAMNIFHWIATQSNSSDCTMQDLVHTLNYLTHNLHLNPEHIWKLLCEIDDSNGNVLQILANAHPKFEFIKLLTVLQQDFSFNREILKDLVFSRHQSKNLLHVIDPTLFLEFLIDLKDFFVEDTVVFSELFSENFNILFFFLKMIEEMSVEFTCNFFIYFQRIFGFTTEDFQKLFFLYDVDEKCTFFNWLSATFDVGQIFYTLNYIQSENFICSSDIFDLLTYSISGSINLVQSLFFKKKELRPVLFNLEENFGYHRDTIRLICNAEGFEGSNLFQFAVSVCSSDEEIKEVLDEILFILDDIYEDDNDKINEIFFTMYSNSTTLAHQVILKSLYIGSLNSFDVLMYLIDTGKRRFLLTFEQVQEIFIQTNHEEMTLLQLICKESAYPNTMFENLTNFLAFLKNNFSVDFAQIFEIASGTGMNLLQYIVAAVPIQTIYIQLNSFLSFLLNHLNFKRESICKIFQKTPNYNNLNVVQYLLCKSLSDLESENYREQIESISKICDIDEINDFLTFNDKKDVECMISEIFAKIKICYQEDFDAFLNLLSSVKTVMTEKLHAQESVLQDAMLGNNFHNQNIMQFICKVTEQTLVVFALVQTIKYLDETLGISSTTIRQLLDTPFDSESDKCPMQFFVLKINSFEDINENFEYFKENLPHKYDYMSSIIYPSTLRRNLIYNVMKKSPEKNLLKWSMTSFYKILQNLISKFSFTFNDIKKILLTLPENESCLLLWLSTFSSATDSKVFSNYVDFLNLLKDRFKTESLKEFLTLRNVMNKSIFHIAVEHNPDGKSILNLLQNVQQDLIVSPNLLTELLIPADNKEINVVQAIIRSRIDSLKFSKQFFDELSRIGVCTEDIIEILIRKCKFDMSLFQYLTHNGKEDLFNAISKLISGLKKKFPINLSHLRKLFSLENYTKFEDAKASSDLQKITFEDLKNFIIYLKITFDCDLEFTSQFLSQKWIFGETFIHHIVQNFDSSKELLKTFKDFLKFLKKQVNFKIFDIIEIFRQENSNNEKLLIEILNQNPSYPYLFDVFQDFSKFLRKHFKTNSSNFQNILMIGNKFELNLFQILISKIPPIYDIEDHFSRILQWFRHELKLNVSEIKSLLVCNPGQESWLSNSILYYTLEEDDYYAHPSGFRILENIFEDIVTFLLNFFKDDKSFIRDLLLHQSKKNLTILQTIITQSEVQKLYDDFLQMLLFLKDTLDFDPKSMLDSCFPKNSSMKYNILYLAMKNCLEENMLQDFFTITEFFKDKGLPDSKALERILFLENNDNLNLIQSVVRNSYTQRDAYENLLKIFNFIQSNFNCDSELLIEILVPNSDDSLNLIQYVINRLENDQQLEKLTELLEILKQKFNFTAQNILDILSTLDIYDSNILENIMRNFPAIENNFNRFMYFFIFLNRSLNFDAKLILKFFISPRSSGTNFVCTFFGYFLIDNNLESQLILKFLNVLKTTYHFDTALMTELLRTKHGNGETFISKFFIGDLRETVREHLQDNFDINLDEFLADFLKLAMIREKGINKAANKWMKKPKLPSLPEKKLKNQMSREENRRSRVSKLLNL